MNGFGIALYVLADYYGQGIAFAAQCGYEQIELTVMQKNCRALNLYMKYGFLVCGTRPHGVKYPDGRYDNDYLMVKMLK